MKARLIYALLLVACGPASLMPPTPTAINSSKTATEVVQIAARELVAAGFELIAFTNPNVLQAKRLGTPSAQTPFLNCRFPKQSMPAQAGQSTLTVTVGTLATSGGTRVTIMSRAHMDYSKLPGDVALSGASETDCVSSGAIEARIRAAIQ